MSVFMPVYSVTVQTASLWGVCKNAPVKFVGDDIGKESDENAEKMEGETYEK